MPGTPKRPGILLAMLVLLPLAMSRLEVERRDIFSSCPANGPKPATDLAAKVPCDFDLQRYYQKLLGFGPPFEVSEAARIGYKETN